MKHNTNKKGFTLIELLVVMSIIALLLSILMPALGRARAEAMLTKDSTQVKAILGGFNMYAAGNNGKFPIPGLEARLAGSSGQLIKGRGPENLLENDHAAVFAMSVMQELFNTSILVSPTESGDFVFPVENYGYDDYEPAPAGSGWQLWDDTFVNDLESGSNNSYGMIPVSGKRKANNWGTSSHSPTTFAILGNRGPVDGIADKFSKGNFMHGIDAEWMGPIAFGDGHTETVKTFYPIQTTYLTDSGAANSDNLFFEEEDQATDDDYMPGGMELGQGADVVLTHIKGGSAGDQGAEGDATDQGKGGGSAEFTHD
jgi:prepilin-type N-terminal cleavage/methylation domain-containing protein